MKRTTRGVVAAVLVLAMAAGFVRLGFWQLERLGERRARNAAVRQAQGQAPLTLDAATFAAVSANPAKYDWRPVVAEGTFHHPGDMLLRARGREGRPGVHLVSPLVLADGRVVMVNRGWISAPDAASAVTDSFRTSGPVRVTGVLRPLTESADRGMPAAGRAGADSTWRRIDLAAARARSPGAVLPLYLQRLPSASDPPSPPLAEPLPELSEGNHLSYAVQWFSFATIAVVGLVILLRRKPR
ncbi:SURF1 family protein [Longimicrobium sp.]|uniref:SURF1 family protein n=1 Tax=Longimicrobium sp. TaxID=2029185 RepID=UPI002E2F863B|nr:SURF1 family protein [Longimicrobium sp.]HEX6041190.1 SURF1 family protein [Longimicrobium sp.]